VNAPTTADRPADEELRLFERWNRTATAYPRERTVGELFADQVRGRPEAPALTFGGRTLPYRELDRLTNALAGRMRSLGVGPEVRVALFLDRELAVIVAMLAVVKAGGAYVPLDPSHPPLRLRQIIEDSGAAAVLARGGGQLDALELDLPVVDVDDVLTGRTARDPGHDQPPAAGTRSDSLLYVMYTSGSTGEPKGVCITHRNVVRLVRATNYFTLAPGDRVAQISNAAFDASTLEVWGALLNGGHLVGFDRATVLTPARLAEALRASAIHTVVAATPLFHQIVACDPRTFASTTQLLIGGEPMDPKRAREVVALGGPALTNGYGPTESTTFATTHRVTSVPEDGRRIPIGAPIANTQVYVLDDRLCPRPIGVAGELHIGGDGLARCYLGRADLTADRFRPDPFGRPGARMYATGDVARWLPDAALDFVGRADLQVKVRGFRIELAEIDAVVLRHPAVAEAATVAHGETSENRRLVCYYAGSAGGAPAPAELAEFVRARLPEYMVPVRFIGLDELPKNPNRKVDRGRLPAPDLGPADTPDDGQGGVEPALEAEEREIGSLLAGLLERQAVGPDENFFEIGGHSLVAIRALDQLHERYGVDMPLEELFDDPTARHIAAYVRSHRPAR
jgi:amino acid adenylation domain-containing protein